MNKNFCAYLCLGLAVMAMTGCSDSDNVRVADNNGSAANPDSSEPGNPGNPGVPDEPSIVSPDAARWFEAGAARVAQARARRPDNRPGSARNVVLFVGDGMGVSTVTAARILAGQREGGNGEDNDLSFDRMPYTALSKTYNTDAQTPDSAGTMTAMVTGVKTDIGVLSVAPGVERGNCASSRGRELTTLLELAEMNGKDTGIVTTARLTHATPAATYAKTPDRNWEDNSALPVEAVANGCRDIADQFVSFDVGDGIDVAFGGGRRHFLPITATVEGSAGRRTDGRNLIDEWQDRFADGVYLENAAQFDSLNAASAGHILGLFNASHMQYESDRDNDIDGEPSLSAMTVKALERLQAANNGYVLIVEAGRIDHAHHAGNAFNALNETVELSRAVQATLDRVSLDDTLVVVTADHSHVFTIAGYPTRGNPILGKVVENNDRGAASSNPSDALDDMPFTTVGYTNGAGFVDGGNETDADQRNGAAFMPGRQNLTNVDTQAPGFHQEALVPMFAETHAGEDVGIYAAGPNAALFNGTVEQNVIFHVINRAAALVDDN